MLMPDLCNQTYTAEVLRTQGGADRITEEIARLTVERQRPEQIEGPEEPPTTILHSFARSPRGYHRANRAIEVKGKGTVTVPRINMVRGKQHYLYDVIIAQRGRDILVAVPYHGLAETFFVQIDGTLAGKKAMYERLDITNLVIRLGQRGLAEITVDKSPRKLQIGLTRCQIAYSDPQGRSRDLQQVSMSGGHLGASNVYQFIVAPVLNPKTYHLDVTPILLGFSLFIDGVRKTSAITDRHGNFKLWIGPGATRVERLFPLLDAIESMAGIMFTTSNLPILQSRAITGTEAEQR